MAETKLDAASRKRPPRRGMFVLPSLFTAGNIAAGCDADFVIFCWQEQDASAQPMGDGEIWISKGRSGGLAKQDVRLNPSRFRFEARGQEAMAF